MTVPTEEPRTNVRLCGALTIELDGRRLEGHLRGRQPRLLFAYLVLHRRHPVGRDELVGALWPETPPSSPEDALNTLLSRLRKSLGQGVIRGRSQLTLALPPGATVDIELALEEIQRAERALAHSDWPEAEAAAELTLGLSGGGFLPDVEAPWVEEERRRLEELRLRAMECLAACGLGLGGSRLSATERSARALIGAAPYRETGYRYLMQVLAERGRVAEAVQVFDEFRALLRAELGTLPGPGLRSLHERLLDEHGLSGNTESEDPLAVGPATRTVLSSNLIGPRNANTGRAETLRRTHARLLRQAVAIQAGRRVDEVDDDLIVAFNSSENALACAVRMQQAVELHNRRHPQRQLSVGVALHCGAPVGTDDANSSSLAAMARRLSRRAEPGQILASAPAHALASSAQRFRASGPPKRERRGDRASPATLEVLWEPSAPVAFPLPPALAAQECELFVGREADLERLWRLYEQTKSGGRHVVVLLRGDPGIGKTRLAGRFAFRAHADGAVVLYGRCDEEPLLPHQPFVEAVRQYVVSCPLPELLGQLGPNSGELRRFVPELAERLPGRLAAPLAGDPEGERYRLFEGVNALLLEAAEVRPAVLVLDDLHWADRPTLLLLKHLIRYPRDAPLLVIGTYRESDFEAGHPLAETLADLSRECNLERLSLAALDETTVARIVQSHDSQGPPELVRAIFEETEGNPFFVVEMLRHLAESAGVGKAGRSVPDLSAVETGVPEGIKDVIGRRIARLGVRTHQVLSVASVLGRDFELEILENVSDLDQDQLVEALERAVHARVIEEPAGGVGRYTFSHALIRETIYGNLTATRRALLHRRVAASVEQVHAEDLEPYRGELAHHYSRAGSAGDLEKAIECSVRAGDRSVGQLAYEQAAAHYRRAVSLIDGLGLPARATQRCDLVIAQGEAERRGGDPRYRETLLEGARLAHELDDAERLAHAALANNRGFFSSTAGVDRERVSMLEAALRAHGTADTATHASLLAHLAVELVADSDGLRRAELSDEAVAMARRVGEPRTLLRTLNHRYTALWGPRTLPERLATCREANQLADQLDDPFLAFHGAQFGSHAAMEAGDLALADRLLARAADLAERLGQPIIHWYLTLLCAKRRTISGSLAEAEELAYAGRRIGRNAGEPDALGWSVNQLFVIRFLQAGLKMGRPNFLRAAEIGTAYDATGGFTGSRSLPLLVEAVQIVTFCEVGRTTDARERFDELMRRDLANLGHDWAALVIPALASLACADLDDQRHAVTLYSILEPHADQFVDNGPSWFGATTHHLARLASVLGHFDDADARFADADAAYETLGADAWLVRARLDWARSLVGRGSSSASQQAEVLLRQALEAAGKLGFGELERRSAALLENLAP